MIIVADQQFTDVNMYILPCPSHITVIYWQLTSKRCDIDLGVVFYVLLFNKYHFMSDNEQQDTSSSDYEEEEEVYYVVASLPGDVIKQARQKVASTSKGDNPDSKEDEKDKDARKDEAEENEEESGAMPLNYALIDMDTDQPMLEIEGMFYQGIHDELLGTAMLFDVPSDSDDKKASLLGTTSRVVNFHQVEFYRKGGKG